MRSCWQDRADLWPASAQLRSAAGRQYVEQLMQIVSQTPLLGPSLARAQVVKFLRNLRALDLTEAKIQTSRLFWGFAPFGPRSTQVYDERDEKD